MTVARSNGKPIPLTVVTGGAGWLWLAVLVSAGVLLGRCFEKWL